MLTKLTHLGKGLKSHWQVGVGLLLMILLDGRGWLPQLIPKQWPTGEEPVAGPGAGYLPLVLVTLLLALAEWLYRQWRETN